MVLFIEFKTSKMKEKKAVLEPIYTSSTDNSSLKKLNNINWDTPRKLAESIRDQNLLNTCDKSKDTKKEFKFKFRSSILMASLAKILVSPLRNSCAKIIISNYN